jgi:glycosyltransferase involved in cell wall biosynthesis
MHELSAFILAKNEAEAVPDLMASLKGIRDVVVLDNGSTDGTQELFRKHGARVYDGTGIGKHTVAEEDAAAFTARFGFAPQFTAGEVFDDSGFRRNHGASRCRNDWVVNPDCDERPEWDLAKVKSRMNGQPGLLHRYIHKHNLDGTPLVEFIQCRLYNRHKSQYLGRIHEVLVAKDTNRPALDAEFCPEFVMHHWQKEKAWRANHAAQLEYQAIREETPRNLHYLGREYADHGEWDKALAVYDVYFSTDRGDFPEQKAQAWVARAEGYRSRGRIDDAIHACHMAMVLDPARREPFFLLGRIYLDMNRPSPALVYFSAANAIPYNPKGFMNEMSLYTWGIHDNLSICYLALGMYEQARRHWQEAVKYLPEGPPDSDASREAARILANGRWMYGKEAK